MVAVDSPYSVLPKGVSKVFGDATPCLALWSCFARAAVRTGESSDDLKSWLLERLTCSSTGWVHLCDRLRVRAEELRRTHFRPRLQWSSCIIPVGLRGHRPDGSMPAPFRRTVQPFDFSEISLFPLRASASRAAFQGHRPPSAHALRARNSFKYIARSTSVQALPALSPGALFHSKARPFTILFC